AESQLDMGMVVIQDMIDIISIGLDDSLKVCQHGFGTGLIPASSVVKQDQPVHWRMVEPHVSLMNSILVVSVQDFHRCFIHLEVFLVENHQPQQLPEWPELLPTPHDPVRGC